MDADDPSLSELADAAVAKVLADVPQDCGVVGTGSAGRPARMPQVDLDRMSDKDYYAYMDAQESEESNRVHQFVTIKQLAG